MKKVELDSSLVATVPSQDENSCYYPEEQEDAIQDGCVFKAQGEVHLVMTATLILIARRRPPLQNKIAACYFSIVSKITNQE